ncbi:MAG: hypothetical protein J6S67_25195 [Methanobrevibacter sp.]|nr:hypothetical protein [Methanobrevibacter sp.]
MEIKATLNKPYTDEQRLEFVVTQNHTNGYKIKETELALEAWGLTAQEQEDKEKQELIAQYKRELTEVDEKSIRSVRATLSGTATDADRAFLLQLETRAEELRNLIRELQEEK